MVDDYESFNIVGPTVPTAREVIEFIADETGSPRPMFSVPYAAGYAFGYTPHKHWRTAVREALTAGKAHGHPWPRLASQT